MTFHVNASHGAHGCVASARARSVHRHGMEGVAPGVLTLAEVLGGLLGHPATLPAKAFYDERGARLFEEIMRLDEYYPTRTEREILTTHAADIAAVVGEGSVVVEYGSGSAEKCRILLPYLTPRAYVPVDVSEVQLTAVAEDITSEYGVPVYPVVADFGSAVTLPVPVSLMPAARTALFLGSTIGNFHPHEAVAFIHRVRHTVGPGGTLLLGVDLRKDPTLLHAAYNDARNVTAEFNLNVLRRLRLEFGARLDVTAFAHHAFYEPVVGRVEMHLVARRDTEIEIAGQVIAFGAGEGIWTESSYKYALEELGVLGEEGGMRLDRVWTDERQWFALALYTPGVTDGRGK